MEKLSYGNLVTKIPLLSNTEKGALIMSKKQYTENDTEFMQYIPAKFHTNRKTLLNKRNRMIKHKQHLRSMLFTTCWYPSPVKEIDCDNGNTYVKRTYFSGGKHCRNYYRWCKRQSNRKVRRCEYVPNRSGYKKIYDIWWEIL